MGRPQRRRPFSHLGIPLWLAIGQVLQTAEEESNRSFMTMTNIGCIPPMAQVIRRINSQLNDRYVKAEQKHLPTAPMPFDRTSIDSILGHLQGDSVCVFTELKRSFISVTQS